MNFLKVTTRLVSRQCCQNIPKRQLQHASGESPAMRKHKAICEAYQLDSTIPVHLKGGTKDKLLFATTILLTFFGLGIAITNLFFKKK